MKYKLEPVEREEVLILPNGDSVVIEWTRLRLVYVFDYMDSWPSGKALALNPSER